MSDKEEKYKSFGDEWLEFHDFINGCPLDLIIECDLNIGTGFLMPQELAYYINAKPSLMKRMRCSIDIKKLGKNASKEDINKCLEKHDLQQMPIDEPVNNSNYVQ